MKKYHVYAIVTGSKYLGEIEAESVEDAEQKAFALDTAHVSLCHHCDEEISDPQIQKMEVEEIE